MATQNNEGVYIDAHNDKNGTSHIDFYGSNPQEKHDESIHINIKDDGTGSIVEKYGDEKITTYIDLNKG